MYGCCSSHYHSLSLKCSQVCFLYFLLILFNHLTCLIPETPSHCFFFSLASFLFAHPHLTTQARSLICQVRHWNWSSHNVPQPAVLYVKKKKLPCIPLCFLCVSILSLQYHLSNHGLQPIFLNFNIAKAVCLPAVHIRLCLFRLAF